MDKQIKNKGAQTAKSQKNSHKQVKSRKRKKPRSRRNHKQPRRRNNNNNQRQETGVHSQGGPVDNPSSGPPSLSTVSGRSSNSRGSLGGRRRRREGRRRRQDLVQCIYKLDRKRKLAWTSQNVHIPVDLNSGMRLPGDTPLSQTLEEIAYNRVNPNYCIGFIPRYRRRGVFLKPVGTSQWIDYLIGIQAQGVDVRNYPDVPQGAGSVHFCTGLNIEQVMMFLLENRRVTAQVYSTQPGTTKQLFCYPEPEVTITNDQGFIKVARKYAPPEHQDGFYVNASSVDTRHRGVDYRLSWTRQEVTAGFYLLEFSVNRTSTQTPPDLTPEAIPEPELPEDALDELSKLFDENPEVQDASIKIGPCVIPYELLNKISTYATTKVIDRQFAIDTPKYIARQIRSHGTLTQIQKFRLLRHADKLYQYVCWHLGRMGKSRAIAWLKFRSAMMRFWAALSLGYSPGRFTWWIVLIPRMVYLGVIMVILWMLKLLTSWVGLFLVLILTIRLSSSLVGATATNDWENFRQSVNENRQTIAAEGPIPDLSPILEFESLYDYAEIPQKGDLKVKEHMERLHRRPAVYPIGVVFSCKAPIVHSTSQHNLICGLKSRALLFQPPGSDRAWAVLAETMDGKLEITDFGGYPDYSGDDVEFNSMLFTQHGEVTWNEYISRFPGSKQKKLNEYKRRMEQGRFEERMFCYNTFVKREKVMKISTSDFEPVKPRIIQGSSEPTKVVSGPWFLNYSYALKAAWNPKANIWFCSGYTADTYNAWFNYSVEVMGGVDNCLFIGTDFSTYDATQGAHCMDREVAWYEKLGLTKLLYGDWVLRLKKKYKGYGKGISYTMEDTRKSGESDTSTGNSKNTGEAIGSYWMKLKVKFRMAVQGDDNFTILSFSSLMQCLRRIYHWGKNFCFESVIPRLIGVWEYTTLKGNQVKTWAVDQYGNLIDSEARKWVIDQFHKLPLNATQQRVVDSWIKSKDWTLSKIENINLTKVQVALIRHYKTAVAKVLPGSEEVGEVIFRLEGSEPVFYKQNLTLRQFNMLSPNVKVQAAMDGLAYYVKALGYKLKIQWSDNPTKVEFLSSRFYSLTPEFYSLGKKPGRLMSKVSYFLSKPNMKFSKYQRYLKGSLHSLIPMSNHVPFLRVYVKILLDNLKHLDGIYDYEALKYKIKGGKVHETTECTWSGFTEVYGLDEEAEKIFAAKLACNAGQMPYLMHSEYVDSMVAVDDDLDSV